MFPEVQTIFKKFNQDRSAWCLNGNIYETRHDMDDFIRSCVDSLIAHKLILDNTHFHDTHDTMTWKWRCLR